MTWRAYDLDTAKYVGPIFLSRDKVANFAVALAIDQDRSIDHLHLHRYEPRVKMQSHAVIEPFEVEAL